MTHHAPLACALSPEALQARRDQLLPGLAAHAAVVEPAPGGVRLRFSGADVSVAAIGAVLDAERHCCPFMDFALIAPAGDGDVVLTVTAPEAAQALLADLVGPPRSRS